MKYPNETEAEFLERVERERARGVCVFRDDNDREFILDLIDDYMDIVDAVKQGEE